MLTRVQDIEIIKAPLLEEEEWLVHGFGVREVSIDDYLKASHLSKSYLPRTKQVHGDQIHILNGSRSKTILEGDAFLTDQTGVVCLAHTADCLPVLLCDVKQRVVGAIHTGWRGTVSGILSQTVQRMQKEWQTDLEDLKVALGPAIGGHCYRVGADVVGALEKVNLYPGPWIEERDRNTWYLDIAYANLHLLRALGVRRANVYFSLACTACDLARFRSYRKEGAKEKGQSNFIVKVG